MSVVNRSRFCKLALAICCTLAMAFGANTTGFKAGKAELKSAGPLAFGPDGILFIGDSAGASIVAVDTGDRKSTKSTGSFEIKGINEKIAESRYLHAVGRSPSIANPSDSANRTRSSQWRPQRSPYRGSASSLSISFS